MGDPVLLDTAPLRDQRTMVDVTGPEGIHKTVADVEAAWQGWADREGLSIRRRRGDWTTELHTSRKTIVVYISGGKWIGDCPDCRGGVAAWPCNPRGCCLDCGTIFRLEYPSVDEINELVQLLTVRPVEQRNYHPHLGETIADVRRANAVWQFADRQEGSVDLHTLEQILSPKEYAKLLRELKV